MQKLIKCKTCGADVAKSAITCPHCGAKLGLSVREQYAIISITIVIVITLLLSVILISGGSSGNSIQHTNSVATTNSEILIDYNTFSKIRNGMSYYQVKKLIGAEGTLMSSVGEGEYNTYIMSWDGYGSIGANAVVTFQNNEVISKAQYGLK